MAFRTAHCWHSIIGLAGLLTTTITLHGKRVKQLWPCSSMHYSMHSKMYSLGIYNIQFCRYKLMSVSEYNLIPGGKIKSPKYSSKCRQPSTVGHADILSSNSQLYNSLIHDILGIEMPILDLGNFFTSISTMRKFRQVDQHCWNFWILECERILRTVSLWRQVKIILLFQTGLDWYIYKFQFQIWNRMVER